MDSDRSGAELDGTTLLTGYAVGTFGVVAYVLTAIVQFSQGAEGGPPVTTVGYAVTLLGTPLIAALAAGNLASAGEYTMRDVLVGFGAGGLIFGAAVGWMNWSLADPSAGAVPVREVLFAIALTLSVPGAAAAGALVGERLGGGEGEATATAPSDPESN